MRVSFVLTSDQNIKKIIANRIQIIESNFDLEVTHIAVNTLGNISFARVQGIATPPMLKKALDEWDYTQEFEVLLEFKELDSDE